MNVVVSLWAGIGWYTLSPSLLSFMASKFEINFLPSAITAQLIVDLMQQFAASDDRPRLKNLATIFLKDCCGMSVNSSVGQQSK